jgi:translation elongation factor EF-G
VIAKAYRMADAIRAVGAPVVMGGPHVTEEADEAWPKIVADAERGHNVIIKAQVALAKTLTYANDLISKTQGRATSSMEFSHYDHVRNELAEKVLAAHKTAHREQLVEEEA